MFENPYLDGAAFEERIKGLPKEVRDDILDTHPVGLTLYQQMAFPVVRWLFFGQRGSGKSHLLAHVMLAEAAKGRTVSIVTHEQSHRARDWMVDTIKREAKAHYPKYQLTINKAHYIFTLAKESSCS